MAVCDKIVIPDEKYSAIVKVMCLPYVYKVVSVSLSCMAKREALNRIQPLSPSRRVLLAGE